MEGKVSKNRQIQNKRGVTITTVVVAFLSILLFAQLGSAYQVDEKPTPPAGADQVVSPFENIAPTAQELEDAPVSIERYIAGHSLPAGAVAAVNLDESTKEVSNDSPAPNSSFDYTITVRNTGGVDIPVTVTDNLPSEVIYLASDCPTNDCVYNSGTVIWQGSVAANDEAVLTISVFLKNDAEVDATITNTALIDAPELDTVEVTADITVAEPTASPFQFLPFVIREETPIPGPVALSSTRPTNANTWTLSWTSDPVATKYEVQEAQEPDFSDATTHEVENGTSLPITHPTSPFNVYYYRARSMVGLLPGPWSNQVTVVGGYYDEFDDENTGWSMRRSTYREKVHGFYENGKYVMQVLDRWDWGLASPLQPAPEVPYYIDFEARIVAPANLLSFGMVFGGDWNGQACPPGLSYDEWYRHTNCFNHFYNTNTIFYGPLKMLFERVDRLEWCPNCGGSPMKRLGDIDFANTRDLDGIDREGWNHYRIEVREDSIRVFATKRGGDLKFQFEYDDTRWVNEPYFGFFASTDEYNNSTWRFEYLEVLPLD